MRLIAIGLTTILATLALASSTFGAVNTNSLTGSVGPGFTITMNTPCAPGPLRSRASS